MTAQQPDRADDLPLSPSERAGMRAVDRISGNRRGGGSTRAALGAITLGFELIVIFLTGMTTFGLRVFDPPVIGIIGGLALCAMTVVALACMRSRVGIWLGWLVQALLLASAIFLPAVAVIALIFGGVYAFGMVKGAQIDRQRAVWRAQGLIP